MPYSSLVMHEDESRLIMDIIEKLLVDSNAMSIFIVDKDGQLIASSGDTRDIDSTSLASLTAGNIAATGGLAKLIGEKEFSILFHEGEKENLHISIIGQRVILVIIFDERSSLGLVRLRVKKAGAALEACVSKIVDRMDSSVSSDETLLDEISDDDIENLFK
jgi:predicted regulator of Ras-like GTPase activity (Roadblock/LC7/MglB family)